MSVPTAAPRSAWVHGHRMFLHDDAADPYISGALVRTGVFEPFESEWVAQEVRPGDVVLDIGANIGYFTLLFARLVGPHGRVFAFEPDPANFELLRRNVAANGYRNVELVPSAVSDRTGPARLFRCADNAGDHRAYDSADGRHAVAIEAVELDRYLDRPGLRIDFVKMDIQGSEWRALRGMHGLLRRHPRLKMILEFWPVGLRRCGSSAAALLDLLAEEGFSLYEMVEADRRVERVDAARLLAAYSPETEEFANLLCVKSALTAPGGWAWPAAVRPSPEAPADLRAFARQVRSQGGEDGILAEIFRRVGTETCVAVEFGVETGEENNTAHLIREHGWQALLMEGDEDKFARLAEHYRDCPAVRPVRAVVTSTNIERLLAEHGVPEEFDLLSIDIDGNDYWVWAAVKRWRPRVVVVEYNASKPPPGRWVMRENPDHAWDGTDYFGASLASLADLGRSKGYVLVGTDPRGVNAFFVRADLAPAGRFFDPGLHYLYSPPDYGPHHGGHPPGTGPFEEV
jgi:FkbM family methyltransferase